MWHGGRPFASQRAVIDKARPALATPDPAFQREPGDACNGGQRLTPEAKRFNRINRIISKLGGRVPLKRKRHVRRRHAAPVINHVDARNPAVPQRYRDMGRACVYRVFDQFLERACRALDNLAGSDAIDEVIGEAAY